jgi:ribosome assembly protein YihI (activator of Der GTPase)
MEAKYNKETKRKIELRLSELKKQQSEFFSKKKELIEKRKPRDTSALEPVREEMQTLKAIAGAMSRGKALSEEQQNLVDEKFA